MPPDEQPKLSPQRFRMRTSATLSSTAQPPSSSVETRGTSGLCSGQEARTRSTISSAKRMRFPKEPP